MEPTIGIEPMNLFLTKEALYRLSYVGGYRTIASTVNGPVFCKFNLSPSTIWTDTSLERETRLELATFSLEG